MAQQPAGLGDKGSTWAWRKLRKAILDRDAWTCRHCHAPVHPRTGCPARGCQRCAHVDHWPVPRWAGGPDDPANLVASCRQCNTSPKAKANAGKKTTTTVAQPKPGNGYNLGPYSRDW